MLNLTEFKERVEEEIVDSMLDFMEVCGEDCGYTKKDVTKCGELVVDYLTSLSKLKNPNDAEIMKQVKKLVLALNKLNEKTDYSLIETEERESLWEIIQDAAVASGLQDCPDDVTGEWREW